MFGWLEHNPELDKWENVDDILFLCTGYFMYSMTSFSAEIFLAYYFLSSRQDTVYAVKEGHQLLNSDMYCYFPAIAFD